MTDDWGLNTVLTRSFRGPSRCEHSINTEVAEMHFTLDQRFRIDTVCLPGMLHGVPPIIPCYCRVNPRWGRLHNVLRAYLHHVTVNPQLLEHGSWRFENRHDCITIQCVPLKKRKPVFSVRYLHCHARCNQTICFTIKGIFS